MILVASFDCGIRKECILRFQVNAGITGPFHVLTFTPIIIPVIHKAKYKAHSCFLGLIQDEIESLKVKTKPRSAPEKKRWKLNRQ